MHNHRHKAVLAHVRLVGDGTSKWCNVMPARTGGHGSGLLRPAQGPRARLLLDDGTVEHYEGLEPPSWRHFGRTRFLGKNFFGYDTGCFCFLGLYLLLICLLPLYFDPSYLVLSGSPQRPCV